MERAPTRSEKGQTLKKDRGDSNWAAPRETYFKEEWRRTRGKKQTKITCITKNNSTGDPPRNSIKKQEGEE